MSRIKVGLEKTNIRTQKVVKEVFKLWWIQYENEIN